MVNEKHPHPAACPNDRVMPDRNETSRNSDPTNLISAKERNTKSDFNKDPDGQRLTMKVNRPDREPDVEWRRESRVPEGACSNPRLGPS